MGAVKNMIIEESEKIADAYEAGELTLDEAIASLRDYGWDEHESRESLLEIKPQTQDQTP